MDLLISLFLIIFPRVDVESSKILLISSYFSAPFAVLISVSDHVTVPLLTKDVSMPFTPLLSLLSFVRFEKLSNDNTRGFECNLFSLPLHSLNSSLSLISLSPSSLSYLHTLSSSLLIHSFSSLHVGERVLLTDLSSLLHSPFFPFSLLAISPLLLFSLHY